MLALLLKIGTRTFAIPARSVLEVVPKVSLRPAPDTAPFVAGLLAYRGLILPAVDLCMRVEGRPCQGLLSSRIVVVRRDDTAPVRAYGVVSENVTDVRDLSMNELVRVDAEMAHYIVGTLWSEGEMIHLLDPASILPEHRQPASALERTV